MPRNKKSRPARRTLMRIAADARAETSDEGPRLLSRKEVLARTGVSYVTIWSWMQQNKFPRARTIGRRLAWIKSEVDAWIENLPTAPLKGDSENEAV